MSEQGEKVKLRYCESGPLHLDFHRTTNGTIAYIREKYGVEFLREIIRRTAHDVYRAIHEDLKRGDPEHLVAHWQHFMEREEADFTISRDGEEITMVVRRCPAYAWVLKRGIVPDEAFCEQTIALNNAFAEGTPFEITTKVTGEGMCVQTIRRRRDDTK
ncbi:MAG: hypothetical protein GX230_07405 [Lentisphaerae bacterium]|jgi:hypothetical protein|nr:hypothetical protein [Lentisphaerota bacterium]